MNQPRTICVKCRHHVDSLLTELHSCHHPALERQQRVDPVTGTARYWIWSRLRVDFVAYTDQIHPNCDEINDGECPFYEEKK